MPSPLLYADSERDANQLYFTGISVPDAFLAFGVGRKKYGVFNALEFARARKESALDVVLSLEEWRERAAKRFPAAEKIGIAEIVATLAREFGLKRFVVPEDFPAKCDNVGRFRPFVVFQFAFGECVLDSFERPAILDRLQLVFVPHEYQLLVRVMAQ